MFQFYIVTLPIPYLSGSTVITFFNDISRFFNMLCIIDLNREIRSKLQQCVIIKISTRENGDPRKDQTWGYRPSFDLFVDHHFLLWILSEDGIPRTYSGSSAKPGQMVLTNALQHYAFYKIKSLYFATLLLKRPFFTASLRRDVKNPIFLAN